MPADIMGSTPHLLCACLVICSDDGSVQLQGGYVLTVTTDRQVAAVVVSNEQTSHLAMFAIPDGMTE